MKVRIGVAIGQWPDKTVRPETIFDLIDYFEALDVDSLWVSERLVSSALILEPLTFLSTIAGRSRKMKLGTSTLVLPARNPIILAKELATIDFLSQGRLFPAIGLGGEESKDLLAVGVEKKERAGRTDEATLDGDHAARPHYRRRDGGGATVHAQHARDSQAEVDARPEPP